MKVLSAIALQLATICIGLAMAAWVLAFTVLDSSSPGRALIVSMMSLTNQTSLSSTLYGAYGNPDGSLPAGGNPAAVKAALDRASKDPGFRADLIHEMERHDPPKISGAFLEQVLTSYLSGPIDFNSLRFRDMTIPQESIDRLTWQSQLFRLVAIGGLGLGMFFAAVGVLAAKSKSLAIKRLGQRLTLDSVLLLLLVFVVPFVLNILMPDWGITLLASEIIGSLGVLPLLPATVALLCGLVMIFGSRTAANAPKH